VNKYRQIKRKLRISSCDYQAWGGCSKEAAHPKAVLHILPSAKSELLLQQHDLPEKIRSQITSDLVCGK
jgi:hypothetical protein